MKKVNEVSKKVGVSKRTLQYYDKEGLLLVERDRHNYRIYNMKMMETIWEILMYKEMNFKLKEIKSLLLLSDRDKISCLVQKKEMLKKEMIELRVKMEFISLVQKGGMPLRPLECEGVTYVDRIMELRKRLETQVMKGEQNK